MSKKKEPEFNENLNKGEDAFAEFDKVFEEMRTSFVWSNTKATLLNAIGSTLTKNLTDISVAQYLTEFQKLAIKAFRDQVVTLVDYYLNHPTGEKLPRMLDECKKGFEQLLLTSTGDLENNDRFVAEGQLRPTIVFIGAMEQAKRWILMDTDEDAKEKLSTIVMDPNNICGFYSPKIESLSESLFNNAKVFVSEPTIEDLSLKGEETLDYYLDRPEIDDSEKLKLQETPNFNLPLSDVKKQYKNFGAYKTRLNNIFKKALKDQTVLTNEDLKGINQYLEEYLWYSAHLFSKHEEMGVDSVEAWLQGTSMAEAVYLSIAKAFGQQKMRDIYNSNMEFHTSIKETLFNAMYLLCFYLTQLEDFDLIKKLLKQMDVITDEYGPDINNDLKLAEFYYFLEDLYEYNY